MNEGSAELNTEPNWSFFQAATPANLKMIEGLWYAQQDNEDLLSLLVKGYGGFGYGVSETLYLEDQLADNDIEKNKYDAISYYTKSFDYGIKYMAEKGIDYKELAANDAPIMLPAKLDDKLDEDDMIAVFYMAQAWGGLINLQRDNVVLMSQLGNVKTLMDWVCKQDPEFEYGSCQLFYAFYEAGRPAMIGGNLEKGKQLFLKYIEQ